MNHILNEFYNGILTSRNKSGINNSDYKIKQEQLCQLHKEFINKLPADLLDEFTQLTEFQLEILSMQMEHEFKDGFKLGCHVILEVMEG